MFGKILGAYFGYTLLAPTGHGFIGFLLGLWLGAKFDRGVAGPARHSSYFFSYNHSQAQQVFFTSSFAVMGYVAKSDGVVSQQEIGVAESFMRQLNMNVASRREAIAAFNRGKTAGFDLNAELAKLAKVCVGQFALLSLFIDIQNKAASVDGLTPEKINLINDICIKLGCQPIYERNSNYSYGNYRSAAFTDGASDLSSAYKTLEIASSAADAEVKKAYRKLLGKHHPDRLMAKGLPKEMIKLANEKTAAIKKAYETIKAARAL